MNLYLLLKTLHILSSTILFGTGLGSAYYACVPGAAGSCR
ncbi:integral membrane protein [Pseudomonas aeruginosa PA38182]|nr:integral membrane protein [Pseudomonas aeruginosa PA38182]